MTETEWHDSLDPLPMLLFLGDRASERKLRLFAAACCRRALPRIGNIRSRKAVEVIERFADGQASRQALALVRSSNLSIPGAACVVAAAGPQAHGAWSAYHAAETSANFGRSALRRAEKAHQCDLLRDIIGNPFHPVHLDAAWQRWQDGTVVRLAEAIYQERNFADLPILADALDEAGCDNTHMLEHCRQPGEHVRGCWLLDLILSKER